jgi:hypothetical protein
MSGRAQHSDNVDPKLKMAKLHNNYGNHISWQACLNLLEVSSLPIAQARYLCPWYRHLTPYSKASF